MEHKTEVRELSSYQNLVLYVDIQIPTDPKEVETVMATIYETDSEGFADKNNPLFRMCGKGFGEWTAASTCLTLLLRYHHLPTIKKTLASWILSCKDMPGHTHRLHHQIRYEGENQILGKSAIRLQ